MSFTWSRARDDVRSRGWKWHHHTLIVHPWRGKRNWSFPLCCAYCKQLKTRLWEVLETRLVTLGFKVDQSIYSAWECTHVVVATPHTIVAYCTHCPIIKVMLTKIVSTDKSAVWMSLYKLFIRAASWSRQPATSLSGLQRLQSFDHWNRSILRGKA